ncbi:MAG TPA: hypothetical protein VLA54_07110 [Acidimicrobiia bacterium]|nr:hypothetical protein [Acidimicrobiia bacterium]
MSVQNEWDNGVDQEGTWLYRLGGISAVVLVVGYFVSFPIYFWVGDQPTSGVGAQLAYFADHASGWWAITFLMVFTDLLLVPILFAIYLALKHINKGLMLVALSFTAFLFVILDLAVTWTAYPSLITAGVNYGAATTATQRAAAVAAAAYPSTLVESPIPATYAILIPSLGILFAGLVMRKGVFSRATSHLALATGLTGILFMGSVFIDGLAVLRYVNALLAMFFYLLAGLRLRRLGRSRQGLAGLRSIRRASGENDIAEPKR